MMDAMITAKIVHQTEKAVLALVDVSSAGHDGTNGKTKKVWLPKSQIHVEPAPTASGWRYIDLPFWLVEAKGL